jgi:VWFA-related protein
MKKSKLSGLILSLVCCSPIQGQQQTSPTPQTDEDVVVISTNLVQVDVVITDKEGRHVTDLQPGDFEIYENKKKQQITNFSYVATGVQATRRAGDATNVQPAGLRPSQMRRTVAIVVDDLGISFESIPFVREALRKFVDEQMQPDDQVAIFLTSKSISSLQQFTSDKSRLHAAIADIRFFPGGHGGLSAFEQPSVQMKDATETSEMANKSAGIIADLEAARAANYTVGTFGTLDFIMQGLSELPGRKAMMLYAESFRLFTNQGRNVKLLAYLKRLTDRANRSSTVIYTTDASGLTQPNATASDKVLGLSYTFDPNILLAGSPVGASPEDSRGNQSTVAPSLSQVSRNEGGSSAAFKNLEELMSLRDTQNIESQTVLSLLAQETGGLFTRNTNNLAVGTQKMMEDQKGYYLIGYRPDAPPVDEKTGRPRYHDLTVRVKRAGLRVRSRAGYYGIMAGEARRKARRTREEQLAAAVTSPFYAGGVDVRMTPLFFNDRDAGYYIRALLHLNPQALTFTDEADGVRQTVVDILAVNFGEGGQVIDQYNDTQTIKVPAAAYEQMLHNGLSFVLNIPVKQPGAYQLRMAVRDAASERVGAAGQYIEVPDLNKSVLTLSGIVLSGIEARAVKNVAASASTAAPAALPAGETLGAQFSPALRRVRQGMTLKYDYVIYNAQPDAATGRAQVETQVRLFRDGRQVYSGTLLGLDTSQQTDRKRLSASGRIRIGTELTPGRYVLQVAVTGAGATGKSRPVTVTQSTDFEVVN